MSSSDDEIIVKSTASSKKMDLESDDENNQEERQKKVTLRYGGSVKNKKFSQSSESDENTYHDSSSDASFVDSNTEPDDDDDDDEEDEEIVQPKKKARPTNKADKKTAEVPSKTGKVAEGKNVEPIAPKTKPVGVKKEKPTPTKNKKSTFSVWDMDDDLFNLTPMPTPAKQAVVEAKVVDEEPTPICMSPVQEASSVSLDQEDDDADFERIAERRTKATRLPAPTTKPAVSLPASTKKAPKSIKQSAAAFSFDDDTMFDLDFASASKPAAKKAVQLDTDSDSDQKQVQLPPPATKVSTGVKNIETKPTPTPSSTRTTPAPSSGSIKNSSYFDSDEDIIQTQETTKDGKPVNIFAKLMGNAGKRKAVGATETVVTQKVLQKAPNKAAMNGSNSLFDDDDDNFVDFNKQQQQQPSSSQKQQSSQQPFSSFAPASQQTTSTTSTPKTSTTTTTTTTTTTFTPATTYSRATGDARTSDRECWDAWGEPHFRPQDVAWLPGEPIPFASLASMFSKCEDTTKRLLIISYLRDFLRAVILNSPDHLLEIVYLVSNQVAPAFEGIELGIGNAILEKVIIEATGANQIGLKQRMKELGDLGQVAQSLKSKTQNMLKPKPLSCRQVLATYREIAHISGKSSQDKKKKLISGLFVSAQGNEARFIIRAFQGNLRIHLALQTVLRSLAEAIVLTPPQYKDGSDGTITEEDMILDDAAGDDEADDSDGEDTKPAKKSTRGPGRGRGKDNDDDDDDAGADGGKDNDDNDDEDVVKSDRKAQKKAKAAKATKTTAKAGKEQPLLQRQCQWALKVIESAYNEGPSFDRLIPVVLEYPLPQLKNHCMLTPGVPIKVMLGKPGTSVGFAVDKLIPESQPRPKGKALLSWEYKYDGERAQIHMLPDGSVQIFSRHMEPYTAKYPDVIASLPSVMQPTTKTFIIDCEIVGWDVQRKKILPFQILSTRKRKDVNADDVAIQVQLFPFDMLYYNGRSLMKTEFIERRALLHAAFKQIEGTLQFATYVDGEDEDTIGRFLPQAIADSCEGLMAKPLYGPDSYYVPDKRKWIKLKKDYLEGVGDTLDLVILGAWTGTGKRTGVYGTFLYFCYDPDTEQYQSMTCIGTGYSDANLKDLYDKLQEHRIDEPQENYSFIPDRTNPPDQWFAPYLVAEVKCADLTVSSDYMAAHGTVFGKDGQDGAVGMRFPRFLRLREDKPPTATTGPEQISEMYYNQSSVNQQ